MRNSFSRILVIVGIACLGLTALMLFRQPSAVLGFLMKEVGLDTPEAIEIQETLHRAHTILGSPHDAHNLDEFDAVLVNHPLYAQQLTADQRSFVQTNIARFLGPDAEIGYLNALKAKRLLQANGRKLLEAAEQKAQAENRELTQQEWKTLTEQNFGNTPAHRDPSLLGNTPVLEFFLIRMAGDTAYVQYSQGISMLTAILVRVDEHWMVARIY